MEFINAIGRRKAAVARVYVAAGSGKITINKRDIAAYFPSSILQYIVRQPLATLDAVEKYDIKINLKGGGFKGQSEAARLAIARALVKINEEDKPALRAEGFLTRDSRVVERKKPGRPKHASASSSASVNQLVSILPNYSKRILLYAYVGMPQRLSLVSKSMRFQNRELLVG